MSNAMRGYKTAAILVVGLGALLCLVALCRRVSRTPEYRLRPGSDIELRLQAVREIYRKPAWRAQLSLPAIIRDPDTRLVYEGLSVIAKRGFVGLVPQVRTLCAESPDPLVKASALRVLGELRAPGLGTLAREAMLSPETELCCAGAFVAATAHDKSLMPLLLECARSGPPEARRTALTTLISLRAEACLPLLVDELDKEDVLDAGSALAGLIKITGKNEGLDRDAWLKAIDQQ